MKTQCSDCTITWTSPSTGIRIIPPDGTVAIVVDLGKPGAIRIFENNTLIDGVYMDDNNGSREIVLWQNEWWFRASGSPQVAYVEQPK
jgi:hypothetical protein